MARYRSEGKCNSCGRVYSKGGMTAHIKSCLRKRALSQTATSDQTPQTADFFHLVVEGEDRPVYWMHLEVRADAKLRDIDGFLRDVWLECCGHLSAFKIGETDYLCDVEEPDEENEDFDAGSDEQEERESGGIVGQYGSPWSFFKSSERSMNVALRKVLWPGLNFSYEYDFGSTTYLKLRAVSEIEDAVGDEAIRILARNDPPEIFCSYCEKAATELCAQCIWDGAGLLCDECAPKHECGEDMLLPVVNSPRVGVCGYCGPRNESEDHGR